MKAHTIIYFNYFNITPGEFVSCEICGREAKDIHHIDARGMGGDPTGSKDVIENLMAVCREDHDTYGDVTEFKEMLKKIHLKYMEIYGCPTNKIPLPK
jgi:hypothetical protein